MEKKKNKKKKKKEIEWQGNLYFKNKHLSLVDQITEFREGKRSFQT